MKKSTLFPSFKFYCSNAHFCHRDCIYFPPFKKMDTVCNVTIFMTLNMRKQEKTRGTLTAPSLLPEWASRPQCKEGHAGSPGRFPYVRNGAGSPRRQEGWGSQGWGEKRRELHREGSGHSSLPSRTQRRKVWPRCAETQSEGGGRSTERTGENNPLGNPRGVPAPNQSGRKTA